MNRTAIAFRPGRSRSARATIALSALLLGLAVARPVFAQEAGEQGDDDDGGAPIIVQATRSGRLIQDEPVRVQVVDAEEIDEKLLMSPGNVAMLLGETSGVRVQVTSPALGASTVRMQGLDGRYTSILADGLPLYGGQSSSLGLLTISPADLGQVEVIKGAASALYGSAALGGVINLVSRRPGDQPEASVLANVTQRGGKDLAGYAASRVGEDWGLSLTGALDRQSQQDIDGDGWADMAGYRRWTMRPRLFWDGASGAKVFATLGAMQEERTGGTLPGRTAPDGRPFVEAQDSRRIDGGFVAEAPVGGGLTAHLRGSASDLEHDHAHGDVLESDRHGTSFAEFSLSGGGGATTWLAGAAWQRDTYRSQAFPTFDYTFTVPGLLAQVEHEAGDALTLAASGRIDFHSAYGTHFSPRVSVLYRPGPLTVRASAGRGFFAPTPFVEETEAAGLSRLAPLAGLRAESADTVSLDVGYRAHGLEANAAIFGANLRDAVRLEPDAGGTGVHLRNAPGTSRTRGAELLLLYRTGPLTFVGNWVHIAASEPLLDGSGRQTVPLTPRDTLGFDAMWERRGHGRIGFEAYYTGQQELEDDPYRTRSKPYVELGLMGELILGPVSLFVNAENLLDVRQTRTAPLLRPRRAADGRWTVDAWAPLEGFTLNGGVRLRFGGDRG